MPRPALAERAEKRRLSVLGAEKQGFCRSRYKLDLEPICRRRTLFSLPGTELLYINKQFFNVEGPAKRKKEKKIIFQGLRRHFLYGSLKVKYKFLLFFVPCTSRTRYTLVLDLPTLILQRLVFLCLTVCDHRICISLG